VALAAFVALGKGRVSARTLVVGLVLFAIPFALIYKQPDLGSALVLLAVLVAVVLIGGVQARQLLALGVIGIVISVGVVHFGVLKTYQRDRLTSFVNAPDQPDPKLLQSVSGANEYNQAQAKVAIANGGISGRGIGKGSQTNLAYVPEQRTDFIFTAVGEQTGLIGSALLLGLFAIVIWRTWRAATLSRDLAGTLICVGVLAVIAFEVFENIGMTMGIMPVAGIPLPLMSYGGSAVIATFAALGLVENVRMRRFS
jgi:rod shape determining protein RodA